MDNELNIQKIADYTFFLFKWICIFAFLYSSVGLVIALKKDIPLIMDSTTTTGNIVGFEGKHLSTVGGLNIANTFSSFNVAVVSFQDGNAITRKVLSKYGNTASRTGDSVKIIYSNSNPENAIIDQGTFYNWLTEYIWGFVLLASYLGVKSFSRVPKIG